MTHRFPIKEISAQSGLSAATIDRVLNNRANVSPQTIARVGAAIAELEAQETQLAARGRRMFFDFVIEAPTRFSREVQRAAEHVLPQVGAAVCRLRFLNQEIMDEVDVTQALARIAKRGSQGVCLKARDTPAIRAEVNRLAASGIPVVTLVSDIQASDRSAYVGSDNKSAGRTAAFLVGTALGRAKGTVLSIRSNPSFLGEEERKRAFADALKKTCPNLTLVDVSGGSGVHYETSRLMGRVMGQLGDLRAVYSVGGGNKTILETLRQNRLYPTVFVAHDLDKDNHHLIKAGKIDFVLHHDLETDMLNVLQTFLGHHKLVSNVPPHVVSNVQIITPENIPRKFARLIG